MSSAKAPRARDIAIAILFAGCVALGYRQHALQSELANERRVRLSVEEQLRAARVSSLPDHASQTPRESRNLQRVDVTDSSVRCTRSSLRNSCDDQTIRGNTAAAPTAAELAAQASVAEMRRKRDIELRYGRLFHALQLSEEKAGEVVEILAAESSKDTPASSMYDSQYQLEQRVAAVIGYARLPQFREYQQTLTEHMQAIQIAHRLDARGVPLTEEQRSVLLKALIAERQRLPPPPSEDATAEDGLERLAYWHEELGRRVSSAVSPALTSEQRRHLQEQFDSRAATERAALSQLRERQRSQGASASVLVPVE